MINYAHVIVDLQAGDTGKGKVAHALASQSGKYTHIVRYNGGGNAGHTIYHNGQKLVTHFIPIGVVYGIRSIIGCGCVVDPIKLEAEINELEKYGIQVRGNLFIDKRVHIITQESIDEDSKDTSIGTTKTGNGPTYTKKYNRSGLRALEYYGADNPMITDIYDEFHKQPSSILFEGAQGFELDIDWGDYPYVTSSHCTVGSAVLNGVPPQFIKQIYGVAKAYRTYVGAKNFEPNDPIFEQIRELGQEYGATTGRKRQVDYLNLDDLIVAANVNGVTDLIINKIDILEQLNVFRLYYKEKVINCIESEHFKRYIIDKVLYSCSTVENIIFSTTPHGI